MSSTSEGRWRMERRGRMLDAAARVFARQPYGQASMDDIAHAAGVGKPTLYRYFPSKDALFAAVFVEALADLEAGLEAVLLRERSVEARLLGLVAAIVPTFRDHLVPVQFLDAESASADQAKRRAFREHKARVAGCLARAVDEGVLAGELRDVEGARIADLVIGMIWSATVSWEGSDTNIAHHIVGLVLHGLGAEPVVDAAPWTGTRPAPRPALLEGAA